MTGLSRDILKWLQSLDLSYSVKNVKRDFSNGFLVAEIFSRYFPHDIQMHSYDNGISLSKKLANWELLEKFLLKRRVPIGRDMIDMVIHCKNDAALPLLETIYTCLTSKKVHTVRVNNEDELIPPFARATASFEIKQNIKDSELLTTLQDDNTRKSNTSQLMQSHDATLREERLLEPGRFSVASPQRSSQRVPPRPMQAEVPTGQIEFKEVQVRTLEKQNITQLRASRGVGGQGSTSMAEDSAHHSHSHHHHSTGEMAVKSVKTVTAILNPCVENHASLYDQLLELSNTDPVENPIISMVDALVSRKIGENIDDMCSEVLSAILDEKSRKVHELVESFIASPMELWRFFHIFTNLLHLPETHACYNITVDLMCTIGQRMMEADAYVASGLFVEYGLPKMAPLLASRPAKRRALLETAYSFCDAPYHLKFIKSLQESLNDMQHFIHCLVVLMHLEATAGTEGQRFPEDLLDLYLYYAIVGLGQQAASLRAAALSMLVIVADDGENGVTLIMPQLDKLAALKEDGWWEVSAQLVRLCAALLKRNASMAQSRDVLELLYSILHTRLQSPLAKKVAVSAIADCYPALAREASEMSQSHLNPEDNIYALICQQYTDMLRSLSERDFAVLLALPPGRHVTSSSHLLMPLQSPLHVLPPIDVAELLTEKITGASLGHLVEQGGTADAGGGLENLEPEHVEILLRLIHAATVDPGAAGRVEEDIYMLTAPNAPLLDSFVHDCGRWFDVLKAMELHVYVALADDELCDRIVVVLSKWIRSIESASPGQTFKTFETLKKALKLVFKGQEQMAECCQQAALSLLMILREVPGGAVAEEMTKLVTEANVAKELFDLSENLPSRPNSGQRQPAAAAGGYRFLPQIDKKRAQEWLRPLQRGGGD